jgi:hypothetical protein
MPDLDYGLKTITMGQPMGFVDEFSPRGNVARVAVCVKIERADPAALSWPLYRRLGLESPARIWLQYKHILSNLSILEHLLILCFKNSPLSI